jgi:hypothetical protein
MRNWDNGRLQDLGAVSPGAQASARRQGRYLPFLIFAIMALVGLRAAAQEDSASGARIQGTLAKESQSDPAGAARPKIADLPQETKKEEREKKNLGDSAMGSPYVPLESWIYPAFNHLIARGVIEDGLVGIRPWTRMACARLLDEIQGKYYQVERELSKEEFQQYQALIREFSRELALLDGGQNRSLQMESVYTRSMGISGPPLTDAYHFGETLTNDYGRPYQEGFSNITGISGWATSGRWIAYARGEYQHAPAAPVLSDSVRLWEATIDQSLPVKPASVPFTRNQVRLMDAYVGMSAGNWQFSFGQRSTWWGPGEGGGMMLSNNAPPVLAFHADRVVPFRLPGFLWHLGPIRIEASFGQLAGNSYPPRPFFHGEKISFKPTPNLEFGLTRTAEMGGVGKPLTFSSLFNSYFSIGHKEAFAANANPGKRTAGLDFSYRIPFVRNWLTLYTDALSDDDPTPVLTPRRAAYNPGIYMPQIPHMPRLDLRVEGVYTEIPEQTYDPGHFVYWDTFYKDLYTNKGYLMGNWIGRGGVGIQAWSRYDLGSRNSVQFEYRHAKIDGLFVPGGGTINDGSVRVDMWVKSAWNLNVFVQYEKWSFPIMAAGPQNNVTTAIQLTYSPEPKASK